MNTQPQGHHAPTNLEAEIAALRAENARLKANKTSQGTGIRLSAKGGISLYGLGRFPVTLYVSQWEAVAASLPAIQKFIQDNAQAIADAQPQAEAKQA